MDISANREADVMYKLLIEFPDGNQIITEISETGGFFDQSKVLWDERTDGKLPEGVELGKMERRGNKLIKLDNYKPEFVQLKQAKDQEKINEKLALLWAAADAHINSEINGVALSMLSAGVQNAKPKAIAVANWCDAIWTEYYIRKAGITADAEVNLDFSEFGGKPHTVIELREEISNLWTGN